MADMPIFLKNLSEVILSHTIFWLLEPSRIVWFILLSLGISQDRTSSLELGSKTNKPYHFKVFYEDILRFPNILKKYCTQVNCYLTQLI